MGTNYIYIGETKILVIIIIILKYSYHSYNVFNHLLLNGRSNITSKWHFLNVNWNTESILDIMNTLDDLNKVVFNLNEILKFKVDSFYNYNVRGVNIDYGE